MGVRIPKYLPRKHHEVATLFGALHTRVIVLAVPPAGIERPGGAARLLPGRLVLALEGLLASRQSSRLSTMLGHVEKPTSDIITGLEPVS